jgi:hypothetical protein
VQVTVQVEDGEASRRAPSTSTGNRVRRIDWVRPRWIRDADIGSPAGYAASMRSSPSRRTP